MGYTAERRPRQGGVPDDAHGGGTRARVQRAADVTPACSLCGDPLPARRRRFCSDLCRRRGQRAERITENDTYAASVVRQIRSMGRRACADLEALQWLAGAADYARTALAMAVDGCRAQGYSDGEIGAALGITRQGVGQRFGRKRDVHTGWAGTGDPA
jgi:hypothetical protein